MLMDVDKTIVSQGARQEQQDIKTRLKTQIKTQITPVPSLTDIGSLCDILGCDIEFFFNKIKKYTDLELYLENNKIKFVGSIDIDKFNEVLYILIKECFLCKECGSTQLSKKCELCGTKASSLRKRISFAKTKIPEELEQKIRRLKRFNMIDSSINLGVYSDDDLVALEEKVNSMIDSIDKRYSDCMNKLYALRDTKQDTTEIDKTIDTFWDDTNDNITFLSRMEEYLST